MPPRSWKVGNLRRAGTQTSVMEMLLSPAPDATLRLMTSPPPAQPATVSAAGGGEDPAREEAPAETKRAPPGAPSTRHKRCSVVAFVFDGNHAIVCLSELMPISE
ncbi:hypothetical protein ON010_g13929 [Phytophthora cinnamomi]|nr:hypothetical protein ON010_g13929 [Phytophthora cinnamomi]